MTTPQSTTTTTTTMCSVLTLTTHIVCMVDKHSRICMYIPPNKHMANKITQSKDNAIVCEFNHSVGLDRYIQFMIHTTYEYIQFQTLTRYGYTTMNTMVILSIKSNIDNSANVCWNRSGFDGKLIRAATNKETLAQHQSAIGIQFPSMRHRSVCRTGGNCYKGGLYYIYTHSMLNCVRHIAHAIGERRTCHEMIS